MLPFIEPARRSGVEEEMMRKSDLTVVIGGNGKTGLRVVERLARREYAVRGVSRSSAVPFDWQTPATWEPALRGAHSIYLTYHPDLAAPGAADHVRQLTEQAVAQGVQRIVLLAGRGEPQVHPAEEAVRRSGAAWTIFECAFFNQNFSEGVLTPQGGIIAFPGGQCAEPFIDCDDIADAAVAALLDARHEGQTYELTGPRCLTFDEVAAAIHQATGISMQYRPISFEAYADALRPHMLAPHVAFFIELFRFLMDGHNSHTTDGLERVLGRPGKDFTDYARDAAKMWR
ncbi:MAG: NAD(P)H-binding protein [Myxococcota bacterium]